jgi:putative phage-type endonuclease
MEETQTTDTQASDESDKKRLRARVKTLMKKPQPEQRTPEWYAARYTRITASEAASCLYKSKSACEEYVKQFDLKNFKYKDTEPLNHYETREDYIIKKCSAFYGENVFKDSIYTLWGKKYEDVANRLYCQLYNTTVHEFGLIAHSRLRWLAASPDGITPDGVMLEIKCPKSRKIEENVVPIHYWVQTQIQLEVTDLDICDFFECEIEELETEVEFQEKILGERQAKGIILQIQKEGEPKFIYPPISIRETEEYINWKNTQIEQDPTLKPTYFFITKYNNQRVPRSKTWFASVRDQIKQTWEIVMNLQKSEENFIKYKQSIHQLRSKKFYDKFNTTNCEIEDDISSFIFEENNSENESINECADKETDEKNIIQSKKNDVICLID